MTTRFLGSLGESTLKTWCNQVGLIANKAEQDLAGWDYLVEFPIDVNKSNRPLDKESFPLRCFLQVKATDSSPGAWDVKLDNWLRLVKNPLPCFFLVLEFDGSPICQRAYLIHVNQEYIAMVLKRLRSIEPHKTNTIHKKTMRFTYNNGQILRTLDGEGLWSAIQKLIDTSPEDYTQWKNEYIQSVGYEDGHWSINIIFLPPPSTQADPQEALVDFLIGITPHLETTRLEINDYRFGILAPGAKKIIDEPGRLEVERKSIGVGTIKLRIPGSREEVRVNTDVYVPQGIGMVLPDKYLKVRFAAPFISFVLWPSHSSTCKFSFTMPDIDKEHTLRDLQPISRIMLLLNDSEQTKKPVDLEMMLNSSPLSSGNVVVEAPINRDVVIIAEIFKKAWLIAQYFDLDQDIVVLPTSLLQQADPIKFMAAVVSRERAWFRIQFWGSSSHFDVNKPCCVPITGSVSIGLNRVLVAVAVIGELKPTGLINEDEQQYELITTNVEICRRYVFDREETIPFTKEDLRKTVIDEYQEQNTVVLLDKY